MPELTWMLFLRVLDEQEALGLSYALSLVSPLRWQDWAAPWSERPDAPRTSDGRPLGWRRRAHIRVGKKTPLTLQRFAGFFELLDKRGTPDAETEHSWTADFAERRRKAAGEAAPHRREANARPLCASKPRRIARPIRRNGQTP